MFGTKKTPFGFYAIFFLVGGVVGASVALLLAPTTGKKLQKQVKEVFGDFSEKVEDISTAVRKVVNT